MSDKYSIEDLVSSAFNHKPTEFVDIFNNVIVNKIQSAIEDRKHDIAQSMFNSNNENSEE